MIRLILVALRPRSATYKLLSMIMNQGLKILSTSSGLYMVVVEKNKKKVMMIITRMIIIIIRITMIITIRITMIKQANKNSLLDIGRIRTIL